MSLFYKLVRFLGGLRQLLPSCCALCGQTTQDTMCLPCRQHYFGILQSRCSVCAMPVPDAPMPVAAMPAAAMASGTQGGPALHQPVLRCGVCLLTPPLFDATIVAADYLPPLDLLVQELKFGGKLALAPLFAGLLLDALIDNPNRNPNNSRHSWKDKRTLPDILACVPLSGARLMTRGYNQTLEIAKPLARLSGIPLQAQLLIRRRDTMPQTALTPSERHRNIIGAFEVNPRFPSVGTHGNALTGCHIGVVDDVITTGQTLNEIAIALKRNGATRATNLVFARTLR
jgi:ComF family protein